jgi:chromosome segregation ATPase
MALADAALATADDADGQQPMMEEEAEQGAAPSAPSSSRRTSLLASLDAVLREADLLRQSARRLAASARASEREAHSLEAQRGDLADAISRAARGIEAEKARLGEASLARQRQEEADACRAVVSRETPREESLRAIAEGERELGRVRREHARLRGVAEARRRQFALLLHVLQDLEGVADPGQVATAMEEEEEGEEAAAAAGGGGAAAMAVDAAKPAAAAGCGAR